MVSPFHLAIPVGNLEDTRLFYGQVLGCIEGRSTQNWIDWNFYGHQLTTHIKPDEIGLVIGRGTVDGKAVPCRHFGVILEWQAWHDLKERLENQTVLPKLEFIIDPYIRFAGETGEQATMFFLDLSGNALEFKSFKDMNEIFRGYDTLKSA